MTRIDTVPVEQILAGMTADQRRRALETLLSTLSAETVAEAVASLLPQEAIPGLLLPYLMDTDQVAQAMTARAAELGSPDRKYNNVAVLKRIGRGKSLPATGRMVNGGHTFWKWDIDEMLKNLKPTVGRPPDGGRRPSED